MKVRDLRNPIDGGQVSLVSVLAWCIREMRLNKLHNANGNELKFNLKLDGRPFWGKQNTFSSNRLSPQSLVNPRISFKIGLKLIRYLFNPVLKLIL